MPFIPEGGTYGTFEWTTELSGTASATRVAGADRQQKTELSVAHTVHVYFADAARPNAYHVIHHMVLEASCGTALADRRDARGFFNSSVRVGYRNTPTVSANSTIRRITALPASADNDFDLVFEGQEIEMYATTGGGSGKILYKPSHQVRNRVADWSLNAASTPPAWELHQRSVWNAYNVDGAVPGATDAAIPAGWIRPLFDGTPFGKVAEMPKSSFGTVKAEVLSMWKIAGTYKPESRAVTLKLELDYTHRANLFHNGNFDNYEPRRVPAVTSLTTESKELKLHEIVLAP